ncbi:hypothetical protein [Pseudomonas sp. A214]|uniref:hypothetical protein n=1 Tax=Pseudomonas sp. A214 TaxID=1855331 RepID=UPI000970CD41|nr:hypothetical protein [Pseudomonas sp. A214]
MHVKSIKLINFKKKRDDPLEFNDGVNIFVGDKNSGKSIEELFLAESCFKTTAMISPPVARKHGWLAKNTGLLTSMLTFEHGLESVWLGNENGC